MYARNAGAISCPPFGSSFGRSNVLSLGHPGLTKNPGICRPGQIRSAGKYATGIFPVPASPRRICRTSGLIQSPQSSGKWSTKGVPFTRWWRGVDSNHRRLSQQIYSLPPLATREPLPTRCVFSTGTIGMSIEIPINHSIKSKPYWSKAGRK